MVNTLKFENLVDKTFSTIIPSLQIEVFGSIYTLDDEITLAGLYQLEDLRFFYAALANFIQEKYSLTPDIVDKLTPIDLQFLQLELKKNSDGKILKINFQCPDETCATPLKADIDLDKIQIKNSKNFTKVLTVDDSTKLVIGVPYYKEYFSIVSEFTNLKDDDYQKVIEKNIELFKVSIKSIIQGDVVTVVTDEVRNDPQFNDFFKRKLRKQYKEYEEYLQNESPELKYDEKIICAKCNKKIALGVEDFFYSAL